MSERKEKWTPGPWEIKTNPTCHTIKTAGEFGEAGGRQVCNVPKPNNPESTANAQLIASAPKLYAVLDDLMCQIRDRNPDKIRALQILAAARGENQ